MADVRERWLSGRAVALHAGLLVAVPGCAIAAWWQINRAQDGNQLSYLYSVMWPAFGLLAIIFWWMFLHTDYESVGLKGMRRQQAEGLASQASGGKVATSPASTPFIPEASIASASASASASVADDDPDLAAYNARLASLAAKGAKTWRNRESVVVRRTQ
jgi:hypothetical protein